MFAEFERYIKAHTLLSDTDLELMRAACTARTLRRKQFLLQAGEICRHKIFISKGFLRMYRTTANGSEHIFNFLPENSWSTDPESYHNLTPSLYYIDALENSEVILWNRTDFDNLLAQIPFLKNYSEKLMFNNLNFSRQRIFSSISLTAEEKYDEFIKNNPQVAARVPLHMIASYLGVSRETLSRIRHAQVKR